MTKTRISTTIILLGLPIVILYLAGQNRIENWHIEYDEGLATQDPYKYFLALQARCNRLENYTCIFEKQEWINGSINKIQTYKVKFRAWPFSVLMENIKNPNGAKRILYIRDKIVQNGKQFMLVVPSGGVARFFFPVNNIAIDDPKVLENSRNTIDDFGFANSINRIVDGLEKIYFVGRGLSNGKPVDIYRCILKKGKEVYVHVDKELNIPVSISVFEKDKFLGYYNFSEVQLNVNLQDDDFSL